MGLMFLAPFLLLFLALQRYGRMGLTTGSYR
jgi:ABC-type maltose transport system permease subunit